MEGAYGAGSGHREGSQSVCIMQLALRRRGLMRRRASNEAVPAAAAVELRSVEEAGRLLEEVARAAVAQLWGQQGEQDGQNGQSGQQATEGGGEVGLSAAAPEAGAEELGGTQNEDLRALVSGVVYVRRGQDPPPSTVRVGGAAGAAGTAFAGLEAASLCAGCVLHALALHWAGAKMQKGMHYLLQVGRACVYVVRREDGAFYVGEQCVCSCLDICFTLLSAREASSEPQRLGRQAAAPPPWLPWPL